MLLCGIGNISKGKVPFYPISDSQDFVASVEIIICAVHSKMGRLFVLLVHWAKKAHVNAAASSVSNPVARLIQ